MSEQTRSTIHDALRRAETPSAVLTILQRLRRRRKNPLPPRLLAEAHVEAFRVLRTLTRDEPRTALQLLLDTVLSFCIDPKLPDSDELRLPMHWARETFRDWMDDLPTPERERTRTVALDRLRAVLSGPRTTPTACWIVARIGYRQDDVVEALWVVAARPDPTGDAALGTLSSLGLHGADRERLLSMLHDRAAPTNVDIWAALRRLADPRSIAVAVRLWPSLGDAPDTRLAAELALRTIADAAYASDDPFLGAHAWTTIVGLTGQRNDMRERLPFAGDLAPRCPSPAVVPTLLSDLAQNTSPEEGAAWRRHVTYDRLGECVHPDHLAGWPLAPSGLVEGIIEGDATRNTEASGRWTTALMRVKGSAWETLLRAGHHAALTWIEPAISFETSGFVRREIEELVAALRLDPLPPSIARWVSEDYDEDPNSTPGEWQARAAAIAVARSAGSTDAFRRLATPGLRINGQVLRQSADAFTDVALALARAGDSTVVPTVIEVATRGAGAASAVASAAAELLAGARLLGREHIGPLLDAAADAERPAYEASCLVGAVGMLEWVDLEEAQVRRLAMFAERDDELGHRALEALARHGRLLDYPKLTTARLGLGRSGDSWVFLPDATRVSWAPYVLGAIYARDVSFASVIASALTALDSGAATQILHWLLRTHGQPEQPPPPDVVINALVVRSRERQTTWSAETELLDVLRRLAPMSLTSASWPWRDWLPEARAALADALGRCGQLDPHASQLLNEMTADATYGVRRAALRALSKAALQYLVRLMAAWTRAEDRELRCRAAEALAFLDDGTFSQIRSELAVDRESIVRDTVSRATEERHQRLWADEYLDRILSVFDLDNRAVLAAWRYGGALARVGDDETLWRLREDPRAIERPLHVRSWHEWIDEKLSETWSKRVKSWPDAWRPWRGHIEITSGHLVLDGEPQYGGITLWRRDPATPTDVGEWGGAAKLLDPNILGGLDRGDIELRLDDGRRGRVLPTGILAADVTFHGTGSYPT